MGDSPYIPLHAPGECYLCDTFHRYYINPEGRIQYHQPLQRMEDDQGYVVYWPRQNRQRVEPYVQPGIVDIFNEFFHELRGPVCLTAVSITAIGAIFFMTIIVLMKIINFQFDYE